MASFQLKSVPRRYWRGVWLASNPAILKHYPILTEAIERQKAMRDGDWISHIVIEEVQRNDIVVCVWCLNMDDGRAGVRRYNVFSVCVPIDGDWFCDADLGRAARWADLPKIIPPGR